MGMRVEKDKNSCATACPTDSHKHHAHEHEHHHEHRHEHEHHHEHGEHHEHEHCACGHDHGHTHSHSHDHGGCGCGCGHSHDHGGDPRTRLLRIGIGGLFLVLALIYPRLGFEWRYADWIRIGLFAVAYLVAGGDILLSAVRGLWSGGSVLDENFLMGIATVGAFAIGEYAEGVAVMLFYQVGEMFQDLAVSRSRRSITALMNVRPDSATVLRGGEELSVSPEEVEVGETILLRPGEKVPLDVEIVEGNTTADTSVLTGESMPREIACGDMLLSGSVNLTGAVHGKVLSRYSESTVAKLLELVENASEKKSRSENFITRFARWYTPAVVVLAVLVAVLPPVVGMGSFSEWLYNALIFLVVSCPCALVVSIPLSFFGGVGGASRNGILVKGASYLEALAKAGVVVFDKTGTLTKGSFGVRGVHVERGSSEEMLELAALAESYSHHPISRSLIEAYGREPDVSRVSDVTEVAGHGVTATVDGKQVAVGNDKLMRSLGIDCPTAEQTGTTVHVALEREYLGYILIADEIKPDSAEAVRRLKALGVHETVILTGDAETTGQQVGRELGVDRVFCELLPGQKVERLEELLTSKPPKRTLLFVGDGINDAPVLARADVGIAMGGLGSDAAIEAADVVIMNDEPSRIALAVRIARRTIMIARENIVFALAVKAAVMLLSVLGLATMWFAVFADVGVALLAVLNSLRTLHIKK